MALLPVDSVQMYKTNLRADACRQTLLSLLARCSGLFSRLLRPSSTVTIEGALENVTRGSARTLSPLLAVNTPGGLGGGTVAATVGRGAVTEVEERTGEGEALAGEAEPGVRGGVAAGEGEEEMTGAERTVLRWDESSAGVFLSLVSCVGDADAEEVGVMTAAGEQTGPMPTPMASATVEPGGVVCSLPRFSPISLVTLSTRISATLRGRSLSLRERVGEAEGDDVWDSALLDSPSPGTVR